jgi:hypothetical protein
MLTMDDDWPGLYEDEDEHLKVLTEMLATWARTTYDDVKAYRAAAENMQEVDENYEAGGMYAYPDQEWKLAFERWYVAGFRLISSAFQMEKWLKAHRAQRGLPHQESDALRVLRNTLEHLDEAKFEFGLARKKDGHKGKPSIDQLPGGALRLIWNRSATDSLFGQISVEKLNERAVRLIDYDQEPSVRLFEPSDVNYDNMRYGYDDGITVEE